MSRERGINAACSATAIRARIIQRTAPASGSIGNFSANRERTWMAGTSSARTTRFALLPGLDGGG